MPGRRPHDARSSSASTLSIAAAVFALAVAGCGRAKPDASTAAGDGAAASPGFIAGIVDTGAEAPRSDGPWTLGIALFDPETLMPGDVKPLDQPSLWTTRSVQRLPAEFSVDIGMPYEGWVVVVLDDDGSGLLDSPRGGDLIGTSAEPVQSPVTDVRVYLEDVWEL
jgi:hypothetical protein